MADPIRNFFKSTLVGTYTDSDTSLTLATGDGALLPDPSTDGAFNLTIFEGLQVTNSTTFEIVRVTARSGDVLTVTRGQESTTPLTIGSATHSILMSATKKTFDDINDAIDNVDLTTLTGVEELTFDSTGDEEFGLPTGTTGQRPSSPSQGYMRYNTDDGIGVEVYNGSRWVSLGAGFAQLALEVAELSVTANDAVAENIILEVEYLVIAGAGGGGENRAGGGGAGGYRSSVSGESSGGGASAESPLDLDVSTNYTVTVGAGGSGATGSPGSGSDGSDSVFNTITSTGGGGAGSAGQTGSNGGSGGGGGAASSGGGTNSGGSGTSGQGFDGGTGPDTFNNGRGAGGGGAGAVGVDGSATGNGGAGVASSITGTSVTRGGGGGGGKDASASAGSGGSGGGGNGGYGTDSTYGANGAGENGTANTGGGGGGGGGTINVIGSTGGNGGSGVVILRYSSDYSITIGAGLTGSETTDGSEKYAEITAGTGNVSWT